MTEPGPLLYAGMVGLWAVGLSAAAVAVLRCRAPGGASGHRCRRGARRPVLLRVAVTDVMAGRMLLRAMSQDRAVPRRRRRSARRTRQLLRLVSALVDWVGADTVPVPAPLARRLLALLDSCASGPAGTPGWRQVRTLSVLLAVELGGRQPAPRRGYQDRPLPPSRRPHRW